MNPTRECTRDGGAILIYGRTYSTLAIPAVAPRLAIDCQGPVGSATGGFSVIAWCRGELLMGHTEW